MSSSAPDLQSWLKCVFDTRARFEISFASVAGRLRLGDDWRTQQLLLPEHLLYFVVEGGFDARLGEEVRQVKAGELLWAARGTQIQYSLPPNGQLVIHRFRLQGYDDNSEVMGLSSPFLHLHSARSCGVWIEQIVDEASHAAPYGEERLRGLLAGLFTEILRLQANSGDGGNWLTRTQREILARYFLENASRWPSPADLAQAVELSPDYFTRCFRRTFGVAPRRWLVEERQRLAALRLLESNLNISQIAQELGYEDVFLFSRQFKAYFGVSPTLYRQNHGAIERLK